MARSHYVMDLFYLTANAAKPSRVDALRIDADNDEAALAEARRIDTWRKTEFYRIRAIHNSSRAGDKVIYSSEPADAASSDAADAGTQPVITPAPKAAKATR